MLQQKRKKFTEELTPEKRMLERWDQQVFFIRRKYPQSEGRISAIMKAHSRKQKGHDFVPSEEALNDLASLYSDLQTH